MIFYWITISITFLYIYADLHEYVSGASESDMLCYTLINILIFRIQQSAGWVSVYNFMRRILGYVSVEYIYLRISLRSFCICYFFMLSNVVLKFVMLRNISGVIKKEVKDLVLIFFSLTICISCTSYSLVIVIGYLSKGPNPN